MKFTAISIQFVLLSEAKRTADWRDANLPKRKEYCRAATLPERTPFSWSRIRANRTPSSRYRTQARKKSLNHDLSGTQVSIH